jgi:pyruvate,water dikinase
MTNATQRVIPFDRVRMTDVDRVGGKNASLGEMIGELGGAGIRVPGGFATTAFAFREFLAHGGLDGRIASRLAALDIDDVAALAAAGAEIRSWVVDAPLPPGRSARQRPPKTSRRPRSQDSRKHFSTSKGWIIFFMP